MPEKVPGWETPEGGMSGKSTDMKLVNDQILHRHQWITVFSPVKVVLDNTGFIEGALWVLGSPDALSGDCLGINV